MVGGGRRSQKPCLAGHWQENDHMRTTLSCPVSQLLPPPAACSAHVPGVLGRRRVNSRRVHRDERSSLAGRHDKPMASRVGGQAGDRRDGRHRRHRQADHDVNGEGQSERAPRPLRGSLLCRNAWVAMSRRGVEGREGLGGGAGGGDYRHEAGGVARGAARPVRPAAAAPLLYNRRRDCCRCCRPHARASGACSACPSRPCAHAHAP